MRKKNSKVPPATIFKFQYHHYQYFVISNQMYYYLLQIKYYLY